MNVNKLFDKVFVINLSHEKFKKKMMLKKLKDLNINFIFMDAINGYNEPYKSQYEEYKNKSYDWNGAHEYEKIRRKKMITSPGSLGYLHTWLKILKLSNERSYKKIAVFDDDVCFDNKFNEKLKLAINDINSFKVLLFGASQHIWKGIKLKKNKRSYNPIEYTDGSFAVGLDCSVFKDLINEISKFNINFDSGPMRYLYKKYNSECYIIYPNIVIADLNTSSTQNSRNMITFSNKFKWNIEHFDYIKYTNILVTIIITVYNSEKTISLSLDSILNQTYNNIEVIIIDDASTDNTLNILKSYKNNDNLKIVELNENMGCYFCKNIGLKLAKGQLIAFQDADDVSLNNRIELQVKEILEIGYDVVGTNILKLNKEISNLKNLNSLIKNEKKRPYFGMITLMFKKKIIDFNGLFNDYYSHSMDLEYMDRLYYKKNKHISNIHCHTLLDKGKFPNYKKIQKTLYVCNHSVNSISRNNSRGHKEYIREKFLNSIIYNSKINYILPIELINFIKENIGIIKFNDNYNFKYLKYFTNSSNNILDINPKYNYKNNFILLDENNFEDNDGNIIKSNKLIITLNEKLYKKYNDMNINTKFIEIYRNYNQTKYDLLNNKVEDINFVFIIPSYNNSPYYKKNLDSVFKQTYTKWRIIYIDDASTDNTYNLVKDYIKLKYFNHKVKIIQNQINMKQAYSRFISYKECNDNEIICFLDGDDWLYDENVLFNLRNEYKNNDILLTFGSYYELNNNNETFKKAINYPLNVIKNKTYRKLRGWFCFPLRTGYAKLYKNMPEIYLKDFDNNWLSSCTDLAEFYWAIEQVDAQFKVIEYPTYVYNVDASKRFKNCTKNISKSQYKYRKKISDYIFNYKSPFA